MYKNRVDKYFIKEIFEKILDIIFPRRCGFCNQQIKEDYTCKNCKKKLEYICVRDYMHGRYFDKCICAYFYTGIVRKIILDYKFKNKKFLCNTLSETLIEILKEYKDKIDIIIAVPISWQRYIERGYNQSVLIAKRIAKDLNIPYLNCVLVKTKNNKKQSTLSIENRKKNVQQVYKVFQKEKIHNKTILLIDDIVTTGATIEECSKILKYNGAKKVFVATIAKAIKQKEKNIEIS